MNSSLVLFKSVLDALKSHYTVNEARELSFMTIEYLFGLSKTQILADKFLIVDSSTQAQLEHIINRLQNQEPIQYITQKATFLEFDFKVSSDVLIPRPETEEIVVRLVEKFKNKSDLQILDVCTGSGCIAISLDKSLQNCKVTGVDISEKALEIAEFNTKKLNSNVQFVKRNVLVDEIELGEFDLIVSNPPYVMESEKKLMQENVLNYEPHLALFVSDNNPLVFYDTITKHASKILKIGGLLAFEINERFGKEVEMILYKYEFVQTQILKDIHGKDRFVVGERKL